MNLLVFDIDGTLLDSTGVDEECYQKAMIETYQLSIDNFNWEMFKDVTDQGVTEDILYDHFNRPATKSELLVVEAAMGKFVRNERINNPGKFSVSPGIESLFEELSSASDIAFCMATGAWEESALAKLSAINYDLSNQPWQHSSHIRRRADIVLAAIEKAKKHYNVQEFDSICALGDGKWDFLTAKELGINFIGVDLHRNNRLKSLGVKKVIHDYPNLIKLCNIAFD